MQKLGFFLVFCLYKSPVKSVTNHPPLTTAPPIENATQVTLYKLEIVANPDYPVAEGQPVHLQCRSHTAIEVEYWFWYHIRNHSYHHVANGSELTLTKPEDSGVYLCEALGRIHVGVSPNHTVYIIAIKATAAEKLGIAAFFFSLLALSISLGVVIWLSQRKPVNTATVSNTPVKSFPEVGTTSKGCMEQEDGDRGVYMNYTSQSYCNLDPSTVIEDNVYSSLS